jgi:RNA polymerase sigma-70 factor (ECF subfamily)
MQSRVLVGVNSRLSASEPTQYLRGDAQGLSDEDLLRLCAQGESAAMQALVQRHQPRLYRLLYRLMGSPEDAEEAVLDVFVRAWQHAPRFQHRARVATWLYRTAVNIAHDSWDRRKVRPQTTSPEAYHLAQNAVGNAEEVALSHLEREDRSRDLQRALHALRAGDRLLLVLYYLEERPYQEIQAITKLPYTVLKTRLTRARHRLRKLLESRDRKTAE